LSKKRVYELAKELNTTSKRLIEKLEEINVSVKNHMSLVEDNDVTALYVHVGIIKQGKDETVADTKTSTPDNSNQRTVKSVQSENTNKENKPAPEKKPHEADRNNRSYVNRADNPTGGLRPGFVRDESTNQNSNFPNRERYNDNRQSGNNEDRRPSNNYRNNNRYFCRDSFSC